MEQLSMMALGNGTESGMASEEHHG